MRHILLDSTLLLNALVRMSVQLQLVRGFAIFTLVVTIGSLIQSWIVEPNLWWFRAQSLVGAIGACAIITSLESARKRLTQGIDEAKLHGGDE